MSIFRKCVAPFQSPASRVPALVLAAVTSVALVAGCAQQPERNSLNLSQPSPSPWALATSTMRWNEYACELIARNQAGQFPASRTLAYLNLAINNAIVSARQQGRKPDGAAAGAAAAVLAFAFPKDEQAVNARLAGETTALGATPAHRVRGRFGDRPRGSDSSDRMGEVRPFRSDLVGDASHRQRQMVQPGAAGETADRPAAGRDAAVFPNHGRGFSRSAASCI